MIYSLRKQPSFFAPGRVAFREKDVLLAKRHSAGSGEGRLFSQAMIDKTITESQNIVICQCPAHKLFASSFCFGK